MTNTTRWQIDIQDIKVNNSSFWQGSRIGVLDTFYNYFTLPAKEYAFFRDFVKIYQSDIICGADKTNCMFPGTCSTRYSKLPDMRV